MSSHQVRCINRSDRQNAHERITHIGGVNGDGTRWKLTQQEAIDGIEARKWTFYVERPAGHPIDVVIGVTGGGRKYLKTRSDGEQPNNLLSLPECP